MGELIKRYVATGSTILDEVGFLKTGEALYLYNYTFLTKTEYVGGAAPKGQVGVEEAVMNALVGGRELYAILLSHEDFKAYNDSCVAKETIKLG